MTRPPRESDSGFSGFDSLPQVSERTISDLQSELIRTLRRDIRDFQDGKVDRCLRNAERVLILRKAIHDLDPLASLYWSIRPSGLEPS